jgi:hypothetical protein
MGNPHYRKLVREATDRIENRMFDPAKQADDFERWWMLQTDGSLSVWRRGGPRGNE